MLVLALVATMTGSSPATLTLPAITMQDDAPETPPVDVAPAGVGQDPTGGFDTSLSFAAGFTWQFETDMNEPGKLSHGRFHTDGNVRLGVVENLDVVLGWRYQYDHWNFSDTAQWWTDINTVQIDAGIRWRLDDHWMIFGGGQALWSVEEGGAWGDGIIGGGAAGFSYAFSRDLIIGGGVGVRSQLEDDALIYPIVVLDWQITDRLSLDTRLTTGWANQSGAELVYELTEDLDIALSVVFDYERFRLDDSGPVAGGVGTTETLPLALTLTWEPIPEASISVYAGATVYGRIKVTNSASQDVYASTYDPAAIIGVQGAIRF
ncbi:MAG: DUF6268 family outer membrane beta-barrel protein [Phycisphaerales bacterium]|nr:DUF6268 family outer membrane beta-barrel protein [Phycisphaerales bacterium]